jgi:rare lipoprotein A
MQPWLHKPLCLIRYAGFFSALSFLVLVSSITLARTNSPAESSAGVASTKPETASLQESITARETKQANTRSRVVPTPPNAEAPGTISSKGLRGKASFYAAKFHGRKTATGEIFNNKLFTAASNLLPLGSLVMVHRPEINMCVIVKVNDRMHPKHRSRVIDLSHSAAKYLDMVREGVVKVTIVPLPSDTTASNVVDCAMGFEVEELCSDCQSSPLQFQDNAPAGVWAN